MRPSVSLRLKEALLARSVNPSWIPWEGVFLARIVYQSMTLVIAILTRMMRSVSWIPWEGVFLARTVVGAKS